MNAISVFWIWFKTHETEILSSYDSIKIGDAIDLYLNQINQDLAWEIGPIKGHFYFAVSPDMNQELVPIAQDVVSSAYDSQYFEFLPGRQRKPWSDLLQIADQQYYDESLKTLCLSEWMFIADQIQKNGCFDILFECGSSSESVMDELEWVSEIIMVGLIGEILALEKVNSIRVVQQFNKSESTRKKPVCLLPEIFNLPLLYNCRIPDDHSCQFSVLAYTMRHSLPMS